MAKEKQKIWFVYILQCLNGRLYTGITVDLEARFAAHEAGKGAMFTRLNRPSHILGAKRCRDRSAASKLEAAIKKLSVEEKRAFATAWPRFKS